MFLLLYIALFGIVFIVLHKDLNKCFLSINKYSIRTPDAATNHTSALRFKASITKVSKQESASFVIDEYGWYC